MLMDSKDLISFITRWSEATKSPDKVTSTKKSPDQYFL